MSKHVHGRKLICVLLTLLLCFNLVTPAAALGMAPDSSSSALSFEKIDDSTVTAETKIGKAPSEEAEAAVFSDSSIVRVSIVLEQEPTLERFDAKGISANAAAMRYRNQLEAKQQAVAAKISQNALAGRKLDMVWNLTLAANLVSANVPYGSIEAIKATEGVADVIIENRYSPDVVSKDETADPNMSTSTEQIGSSIAWGAGYTGAGSRVAIVDTGADLDHISFDGDAFHYSLEQNAKEQGVDLTAYLRQMNLLNETQIATVLPRLNAYAAYEGLTTDDLYINEKIPFGFNYVDEDLDLLHINDDGGEHGSHVAGIATANAYVPNAEGGYDNALETVKVQGVAPDAQLLVMKVFGKNGGAYDSDWLAAIEDAILLDCDSVNLSLGSGNPGFERYGNGAYQEILNRLVDSGVVTVMSAGNAAGWSDGSAATNGYLYSDDVSMATGGSPGTFTNSVAVASVDNIGSTGAYIAVDDYLIFYQDGQGPYNSLLPEVHGEYEYVFTESYGSWSELFNLGSIISLSGKVVVSSRGGGVSFAQKASGANSNGAKACLVYNNTDEGMFGMGIWRATTATCPAPLSPEPTACI